MATHASILAWRIPGMGEPGGLPSMGKECSNYRTIALISHASKVMIKILQPRNGTATAHDRAPRLSFHLCLHAEPSGEPGVSGDFWGSQEGCQGPSRPSGRNRGLPLRDWRLAGLSSPLAFPLDLGARPLCRRLRGRGCANSMEQERTNLESLILTFSPGHWGWG